MNALGRSWYWWVGLTLLVSAHFWLPNFEETSERGTYGTSNVGKKAFYLLVDQQYGMVSRNAQDFDLYARSLGSGSRGFDEPEVLCLLSPSELPGEEAWRSLNRWVSQGGHLLLAVDAVDEELEIDPLGLSIEPRLYDTDWPKSTLMNTDDVIWVSQARVKQDANLLGTRRVPVTLDGEPQVLRFQFGRGTVTVVADATIFENRSIAFRDNSIMAMRLLEQTGANLSGGVVFDESLGETQLPKVVGILFDDELRPITLQLLIATLLFGWWNSLRFGPRANDSISARQNIVTHTDTVGELNHRTRNGSHAVRCYFRHLRDELNLRGDGARLDRQLAPLANRIGRPLGDLKKLLRRAVVAAKSQELSNGEAGKLIRMLARLKAARQTSRRRS